METGAVIAGRYRVQAELGRGGMGAVYLALDERLERVVAVKVLVAATDSDEVLRRFQREGIAAARLRSPHIVTVHDFGVDADRPFIVFEYVAGKTIAELVRGGPLAPPRAVAIAVQACRALEAAHAAGLVHRDIKPSNLMVTEEAGRDHVVVLDFGVAKVSRATDLASTQSGAILGTPSYMSPEQVRGAADVDPRSDLYGLGATLFEMVTGRRPFEASAPYDYFRRIVEEPAPRAATLTKVSKQLDAVIDRCLQKERGQRFADATALREALLATPEASRIDEVAGATLIGRRPPPGWDTISYGGVTADDVTPPPPPAGSRVRELLLGLGLVGAVALLRALGWLSLGETVLGLGAVGGGAFGVGSIRAVRSRRRKPTPEPAPEPTVAEPRPLGPAKITMLTTGPSPTVFEQYFGQAGLQSAGKRNGLHHFQRRGKTAVPPGEYAGVVSPAPSAAPASLATVAFSATADPLFSWPGTEETPHYVLLPLAGPPAAGVYRTWHTLASEHHLHVLAVTAAELNAAIAAGRGEEHLAELVHRARRNPFDLQGPIANQLDFFGSQEELQMRLRELTSERRGFGLFGLEKWGTTSMLLRLRDELADRPAAWVDLAALPDLALDTVLRAIHDELTRDLVAKSDYDPPKELFAADGGTREAVARVVRLGGQLGLSGPPVLFIDRIDELTRQARSTPAAAVEILRALYALAAAARGDRVLLVVGGSDDHFLSLRDFEIDREKVRNPFWRSMNAYYTPFFTAEETAETFARLGGLVGLSFADGALAEAHRLTGGHKYLCRLLGNELSRQRGGAIDAARVRAAAAAVVMRHNDYFRAILEHAPPDATELLSRLADAPAPASELLQLAGSVPARGGGQLAALQFALSYRLIDERDGAHHLSVGILGDWLQRAGARSARG